MAINRNDDYEKLAKLLYPSIEASGNTYYGQTRKLTLDEVFNKNNGGFESHIESVRVDNPSADYDFTYDTLFCWKVGPLSGTLKVNTPYKIGTYFAVYEIVSEPVTCNQFSEIITNVNQLNSGEFNTYEYNTSCEFKEVKETDGKSPVNNTDVYDGRNFYIYKDGIKNYIAVAVNAEEEVPYDENNPLKLTVVNGYVDIELLAIYDSSNPIIDDQSHQMYEYSTDNGSTWNWCELTVEDEHQGVTIHLNTHRSVCFRLKSDATKQFTFNKYVQFRFTGSGKIVASGDIRSMKQNPDGQLESFEFWDLFRGCTQLIKAPALPDKVLADNCYCGMFRGTSLSETPVLNASSLCERSYYRMFSGCVSLHKVICCATDLSAQDCTVLWLISVADSGEFITLNGTNWQTDSVDGIPTGWTRINISDPTEYTDEDCKYNYLVTDGSNSAENGRGDITTNSTLFNMESSFDKNGTHQMNTYNTDGSFNQEVWGYKCFNSPVQFKNGIYGEATNLKTVQEEAVNVDSDANTGTLIRRVQGSEMASTIVDSSFGTLRFAELNTLFTHENSSEHTTIQLQGYANCITSGNKRLTDIWDKYSGSNYDYDNDLSDDARDGSLVATTYESGYRVIDDTTEGYDVASFISKTHIDDSSTLFKCTSDTSSSDITLKLNHKNLFTSVYCNFRSSDDDSAITMSSSVGRSSGLPLQSIVQCDFSANNGVTLKQQKNGGTNKELLKIDDSTISTSCNILPSVTGIDLGSSGHNWGTVYTTNISCIGDIGSNDAKVDNIHTNKLVAKQLLPSDNNSTIGSSSAHFSRIYVDQIQTSSITDSNGVLISAINNTTKYAAIQPTFDTNSSEPVVLIGSGNTSTNTNCYWTFDGTSIIPFNQTSSHIGTSNKKVDSIYAVNTITDSFRCTHNNEDVTRNAYEVITCTNISENRIDNSNLTSPAGAIFPVMISPTAALDTDKEFMPGDIISNVETGLNIVPAMYDADMNWVRLEKNNQQVTLGTMSMRCLVGFKINSNTTFIVIWVQRI